MVNEGGCTIGSKVHAANISEYVFQLFDGSISLSGRDRKELLEVDESLARRLKCQLLAGNTSLLFMSYCN